MASDAMIMQGTTLGVDVLGGTTYATIGSLVSLSGPGTTRTVIVQGDANSTNSTNSQKAGRITPGVWNFVVNLAAAKLDTGAEADVGLAYAQMAIASAAVNLLATQYAWEIVYEDLSDATFNGFVSNFNMDLSDDGGSTASFSVAIQSAAVTFDVPA